MASQAVDSLPYYDRDLDTVPSLRQKVEKDIAAELRVSALSSKTPQHPRLDSLAPPPPPLDAATHPLVAASLARLSLRDPPPPKAGEGLDTARFALPGPSKGEKASVDDWEEAVRNAGAQLEHQRVRLANLELAGQYGANSWKLGNFLVEKELERVQKAVDEANERVVDVNRRRKGMQTEAGQTLTALETRWTELISANIQLEIANFTLQSELRGLEDFEDRLRARLQATD